MSKFLYRLWLPSANIHGEVFDKICPKCQDKIEEHLNNGFLIPTKVSVDTSMVETEGILLNIGSSLHSIAFCPDCTKAFVEWLSKQNHLTFGKGEPELWRSTRDEDWTVPTYIIETKEDKVVVITAKDRDHAFAKYFKDVFAEQTVSLEKIGNVIMLKDGQEEYPFRTVPLLWKMGIIGTKNAIDNLVSVLKVSRKEAKNLLKKYGDADAHLVPLIDDLRLAEEAC